MQELKDLSEECQNHICKCENCGYEPLKHFEECPKCKSEAFHILDLSLIKEDELVMINNVEERVGMSMVGMTTEQFIEDELINIEPSEEPINIEPLEEPISIEPSEEDEEEFEVIEIVDEPIIEDLDLIELKGGIN